VSSAPSAPLVDAPPGPTSVAPLAGGPARSPHFPLVLSADGRYLVEQGGKPFLIQGEAAWSLVAALNRADALSYLDDRQRRKFNLLMVNVLEHKFVPSAPRNAFGQAPFTRDADFSSPNEAYFAHVDWVLREAGKRGFAVLLCPAYLGFDGGDEGWYQEIKRNGVEKMRAYGRYLGQRYRAFDNVIWLEGGDFSPPPEGVALVNAVAEGIKAMAPSQLQAVHWGPETSGQDIAVSGWLDLNTTYTYEPVYLKSLENSRRPQAKPHFLIESKYERERESTPRSLRAQAYYALLTGAVGHIFGNYYIWQFKQPALPIQSSWKTELGSAGTLGITHVRELFESHAFQTLVPDADNEVLVKGAGERGAPDYAVLARSRDGRLAISYLPKQREVTLDLGKLATPIRARFFDPAKGVYSDAPGSPFKAAKPTEFRPVRANGAGDSDWVLVLEAL
jgi:hypothetical protein